MFYKTFEKHILKNIHISNNSFHSLYKRRNEYRKWLLLGFTIKVATVLLL